MTVISSTREPDLYLNLEEVLEKLNNDDSPDAVSARIAWHEHQDLRVYRDPIGRLCFCSREATPYLDRVDVFYDDFDRIYVQAYTIDKGFAIYGDPAVVYVGVRNTQGFGDVPNEDWREYLESLGWDPELIKKVDNHFRNHARVDW